jgi:hypothetical protein
MPSILLMDDTVTEHGHMASGCEAALLKHSFTCGLEAGRDENGAVLASAQLLGKRLFDRVVEEAFDGVVLDISWGLHVPWDGFAIWREAKMSYGLALDKRLVVFLTQHRSHKQCNELAAKYGFQIDQVLFKNAQGNESVVRWFCSQFGIDYRD